MTTDPFVPGPEDDLPDELWLGYPATRFGTAPGYRRRGDLLVPADLATTGPAGAAGPVVAGADTAAVAGGELEPVVLEPELLDDGQEPAVDLDGVAAGRPGGWWGRRRRDDDGEPVLAFELERQLAARRDVTDVNRADELARTTADAEHQMAMAAVAEGLAASQRERAEQARDAAEEEKLTALYRHTAAAGERARVTAELRETGEMRALRIAKTQKVVLWIGVGLLVGFGAWSTAGVQAGLVRLMDLKDGSPGWWAAWILEPLLITIVAGLILLRPILRSAGGDVDNRAYTTEKAVLGVSIALNVLGGWHPIGKTDTAGETVAAVAEALGQALAHSVGAIFAALTAWLIGVVIDYTTNAKPWDNAPRVADIVRQTSEKTSGQAASGGINRGKHGPRPVDVTALPDDVRTLLLAVREAITNETLDPDPSGYAIYKRVMRERGDKARAQRVALLVRGWRPLRAVG